MRLVAAPSWIVMTLAGPPAQAPSAFTSSGRSIRFRLLTTSEAIGSPLRHAHSSGRNGFRRHLRAVGRSTTCLASMPLPRSTNTSSGGSSSDSRGRRNPTTASPSSTTPAPSFDFAARRATEKCVAFTDDCRKPTAWCCGGNARHCGMILHDRHYRGEMGKFDFLPPMTVNSINRIPK